MMYYAMSDGFWTGFTAAPANMFRRFWRERFWTGTSLRTIMGVIATMLPKMSAAGPAAPC